MLVTMPSSAACLPVRHGRTWAAAIEVSDCWWIGQPWVHPGQEGDSRSEEADPDRKVPATQATSHDTTNGVERSHCHCDFVRSLHPDYISSAADADVLLVGRALRCALQTCLICDQTMVVSQLERDGVVTKPIGVYSAHTTPAQIERHVNTR